MPNFAPISSKPLMAYYPTENKEQSVQLQNAITACLNSGYNDLLVYPAYKNSPILLDRNNCVAAPKNFTLCGIRG